MANKIEYPKNINVSGLMAFPLWNEGNIDQLQEWRVRKNLPKPRFADRIGFGLMLNQEQHDRVVSNLTKVYLPFAKTLKKVSGGDKGIDPILIGKLEKLVKEEDWSESNLPIRNLNERDIENNAKNGIEGIVSKLRVAGPSEDKPITRKALVKGDGDDVEVVPISSIADRLGEQTDPDALWWGASWPFKTNVRFNAFNAANFGVSAYVRTAYLLADLELPLFGGNDADVLEDGDDWSDE
jgi:hypothetical protein